MTSQNSTINMNKERKSSLAVLTLRQYWTSILLFSIIMFFVIPLPVIMRVSNELAGNYSTVEDRRLWLAVDWVEGIRYVIIPVMSILAAVIPCARFGYLKNKVSVDFYHSLPIRRERLFFIQLGVGALALVIPYILSVGLTFLFSAAYGVMTTALFINMAMLSLELVVYLLFFYSLSTLVGMVSGLSAVQLVLTVIAIFILPALQLLFVAFASIFSKNMWMDFYVSEEIMAKLSPAIRFVVSTRPLDLIESLALIFVSVLMLSASLLIYLKRKSERAGQPVVFNPLGEVIKYLMMVVGTLIGGILFNAIMGNIGWTIFGMLVGMVLVFMLANTILHKTATAMFHGLKGLIIFGVTAVVILLILATNAFGINDYIPKPAATSRVYVDFQRSDVEIEFKDRDNIEALYKIYTQGKIGRYGWYPNDALSSGETLYLSIVFYNSFGFPTAKTVTIANKSDFVDEFRTILDSDEFRTKYGAYLERVANLPDTYTNIRFDNIYINDYGRVWNDYKYQHLNIDYTSKEYMADAIADYAKRCNFDYFQQPEMGYVYIYDRNGREGNEAYFTLYAGMDDIEEAYIKKGLVNYTYEEQARRLANVIDSVSVYKVNAHDSEDEWVTITDKDKILEILLASSSLYGDTPNAEFNFVDNEYYVNYKLTVSYAFDEKCLDLSEEELAEYIDYAVDSDDYVLHEEDRRFSLAFRLGETPEFIPGMFD